MQKCRNVEMQKYTIEVMQKFRNAVLYCRNVEINVEMYRSRKEEKKKSRKIKIQNYKS